MASIEPDPWSIAGERAQGRAGCSLASLRHVRRLLAIAKLQINLIGLPYGDIR